MDYFTSDPHFCHDRDFVYVPRGFKSVTEMNEAIIKNINDKVSRNDNLYILGDIMLGQNTDEGIMCLSRLQGNKFIILGNHDTDAKVELIKKVPDVTILGLASLYKYGGRKFYLSHYPTCTENFSIEKNSGKMKFTKPLGKQTVNLSGHTHSDKLWDERTFSYNVSLNAHNNYPVSIEEIIEDCRQFYMKNNILIANDGLIWKR